MKRFLIFIKKFFKVILKILIAFIVLIILLSVIAKFKEKDIANLVLKKLSEQIQIPLKIEDISLNLIRNFPLATVELKGVEVGKPDSVHNDGGNLAFIEKTYVSVRSVPLYYGNLEIMKVDIKGIDFSYIINKNGNSNIDFLLDTAKSETNDTGNLNLNLFLKELTIKDSQIFYIDSTKNINGRITIPKIEIGGELRKKHMIANTQGEVILSQLFCKGITIDRIEELGILFDLDYKNDSISINGLNLKAQGAELDILGMVYLKKQLFIDLQVKARDVEVGEMYRFIPAKILKSAGISKAEGIINLSGIVQGDFNDSKLPQLQFDYEYKKGLIEALDLPLIEDIYIAGSFTNGKLRNNKTTKVNIRQIHALCANSSIDMKLNLHNPDSLLFDMDSDVSIFTEDFRQYIPDSLLKVITGRIDLKAKGYGFIPDSLDINYVDKLLETFSINLAFSDLNITKDSTLSIDSLNGNISYREKVIAVNNLNFTYPQKNIYIQSIDLDAAYDGQLADLNNFNIDINSCSVKTDSCNIFFSSKIKNIKSPYVQLFSNIQLNLNELSPLLDSVLNNISGELVARVDFEGALNPDSISNQIMDLVFNKTKSNLIFNKVSVELPDTLFSVSNLSGKVAMEPGVIRIDDLNGLSHGIGFSVDSTEIENFYHSIIKNEDSQLLVKGIVNLGDIDYTMLAPLYAKNNSVDTENKASETDTGQTVINYTKNFKGKFGIKSVKYYNAVANNLSGLFNISDSLYIIDKFSFDGFKGKLESSIKYEIGKSNNSKLSAKNKIENLDINQLLIDFNDFEDFYKPAISHSNISGVLTSKVDAQLLFTNDSFIRDKMYVRGDFKLEKGIIDHYPPVQDMAQHLPGVDNLDILEFKTINTNLFVFQDTVYVPSTTIVSNKLDATALGLQTLDGDYSYHFKVFVRDILTGKNKRLNDKQDKMGEEISDLKRSGLLVKSFKIDGKKGNGVDSKDNQERMRSNINVPQGLLRLRFFPDMVSYDTGID